MNFKVFSLLKMDVPDKDAGVFSLTAAGSDSHRAKARDAAKYAYGMNSAMSKNKNGNSSNKSLRKSSSIKSKSSERSKKSNFKPTPSIRQ